MTDHARDDLERVLGELRPKLHRYCARMTGSAVDGEDIVQDAMIKAFNAQPVVGVVDNLEGWLFRIAHNTALDFLRRRARTPTMQNEMTLDMIAAPDSPDRNHEVAAMSLRTFMRLPALQRGRVRLREFASEPEDIVLPMLSDVMRARLIEYVEGFKAGDFDAVRAILAEDVKLDLVARLRKQGKGEIGEYFSRYAACEQWAFAAGVVDGRAAMLVYDREISLETPAYFVALGFDRDRVVSVHDFLFARYAMDGIDVHIIGLQR